jgi:hypothetical protein
VRDLVSGSGLTFAPRRSLTSGGRTLEVVAAT